MEDSGEKLIGQSISHIKDIDQHYRGMMFCAFMLGILIGLIAGMAIK